ncbi:MAG: L,D-transpeptidase [Verrucomicrobiota bacterium]
MKPSFTYLLILAVGFAFVSTSELQAASSDAKKSGFFSKVFGKKTAEERAARKAERKRQRQRDQIATVSTRGGLFRARTTARYSKPEPKPQTGAYSINQNVLNRSNRYNTEMVIDLSRQKGYLLVDGKVGITTPVSTARPGKYTPTGTFRMTERVRSGKISTIYDVSMPYWMRLSSTEFGVHAGYLPGYPASAGCVRLPYSVAQMIYDNTRSGTLVRIENSWMRF